MPEQRTELVVKPKKLFLSSGGMEIERGREKSAELKLVCQGIGRQASRLMGQVSHQTIKCFSKMSILQRWRQGSSSTEIFFPQEN